MINIVIIMYQGCIEDVKAFKADSDAFAFFEEQTGVPWAHFKERCDVEDTESILSHYAGTNIWKMEVR